MKNIDITLIIKDFDNKLIPDFFDLNFYATDFEISRHLFKSLRIGYIRKTEIKDPGKAIYIDFNKKQFSITIIKDFINIEKDIIKDKYSNYSSLNEVYDKIKLICDNKDFYINDIAIFDELDEMIKKYNKTKDFTDYWPLYEELYTKILNLEIDGKIILKNESIHISHLQEIIDNDGPEYTCIIDFRPTWDFTRKYKIGVCVRGRPLVRRVY